MRPLVSAIIPTHNRAAMLGRAIDSIYAQEGIGEQFDLEVIVVDDASSDSTPDVARRYPGVRYVRLATNRGAAGARNAGIAASTGALIAFLDDDDVWLPHRLKVQVPVLERHPEVAAVYSQLFNSLARREWPDPCVAPSGWLFSVLLETNFLSVPTVLVRREVFDQVGGFDENLVTAEDWDLWLRISFDFPLLFVPGVVAVYNKSPHGLHLDSVARGTDVEAANRVLERALKRLPETAADVKQQARARLALASAAPFMTTGDYAHAWARVVRALRTYPWVIRHDWARTHVVWVAGKWALAAPSPTSTVRALSAQIKTALPTREGRRWARRTIAEIWTGVAVAPYVEDRDAARSAIHAMASSPSLIWQQMALLRPLVRCAFGSRFDTLLVQWGKKIVGLGQSMLKRGAREPH